MDSPCKDCENRHHNCHSQCEDYKAYRDKIDKAFAEKRAAATVRDYQIETSGRIKKLVTRGY